MNSAPLVECVDLAFERDDLPLFSGVNFQLFPSRALQVTGANGTGKTTLLRILATSLTPSSGHLCWQGHPLAGQMSAYRADLLYIGHHAGVKSALSPRENLTWFFRLFPGTDSQDFGQAIDEALGQVSLGGYEEIPCHMLSAGQQRRVALARLYLSSARLWILDEPFTSIDVHGVEALEKLMAQHLQKGGCLVTTSHQQLRLERLDTLQLEAFAVVH